MKIIRTLLLCVVVLLGLSTVAFAADSVKIKVNGVGLSDAQAVLKGGTTLLPVRSVGNALGGNVTWDNTTKTVIVEKDGTTVIAPVGEKFIIVDDETKAINMPPQIIDGKTYIPLRVIGEALSCDITWVNETKTVEISQISSNNLELKEDLFGGGYLDVSFEVPKEIFLGVNEVGFISFDHQIIEGWSTQGALTGIFTSHNGKEGIKLIGIKEGIGQLLIDGGTIKVNVVNMPSTTYLSKYGKNNIVNVEIIGNHTKLIDKEEQTKSKYGIDLATFDFMDKVYMTKENVLIIPVNTNTDLTGTFEVSSSSGTPVGGDIQIVLDKYNGKPAFFIKGEKDGVVDVFVRYIHDNSDKLNFEFEERMTTDIAWHREMFRTKEENNGLETAIWTFELNVVNDNNRNYKSQEALRLKNGIDYDLYLLGLA